MCEDKWVRAWLEDCLVGPTYRLVPQVEMCGRARLAWCGLAGDGLRRCGDLGRKVEKLAEEGKSSFLFFCFLFLF
jgi:hypothetical protein